MLITVEIDEAELKRIIIAHIQDYFNDKYGKFDANKVIFEVKSKQNYRSEWEVADFRARYTTI